MSYALSAPLQVAVFGALSAHPDLTNLVNGAIYDAEPVGGLPARYVTLGAERVRDRSDGTGGGAEHEFDVAVVSDADGFHAAKVIAAAVSDALVNADLALSRGRLVLLRFYKAKAARVENGRVRRIDLTFRARVQDD